MSKDLVDTKKSAKKLRDEDNIIELYSSPNNSHILYSKDEIERLNLMKQINSLNLNELETLIIYYRDELNNFLRDNIYISLTDEEKQEYLKKLLCTIWKLDYLRGIWHQKINELDESAQLAYLTSVKRRKLDVYF